MTRLRRAFDRLGIDLRARRHRRRVVRSRTPGVSQPFAARRETASRAAHFGRRVSERSTARGCRSSATRSTRFSSPLPRLGLFAGRIFIRPGSWYATGATYEDKNGWYTARPHRPAAAWSRCKSRWYIERKPERPKPFSSSGRAAWRAYPARSSSLPPPEKTAQHPSAAHALAAKYVVSATPALTTSMPYTAGAMRANAAAASSVVFTSSTRSRAPIAAAAVLAGVRSEGSARLPVNAAVAATTGMSSFRQHANTATESTPPEKSTPRRVCARSRRRPTPRISRRRRAPS